MAMPNVILFVFLFFLVQGPPPLLPIANAQLLPIINEGGGIDPTEIPIYIVHVEKPPHAEGRHRSLRSRELKNWYMSFLPNTTLSSGKPRMVYAYRVVISGFAARLTSEEVEVMEDTEGFITAYPEREHPVSTTYTPIFLGLRGQAWSTLWHDSSMGAGQIIGVVDTGVSRNHSSFKDDGMTPPPTKWSGKCFWGNARTCNNKLIGAVGFRNGAYADPSDNDGHGTHVAGTAAGNFVSNASVIGQAPGTASGIAPRAHLAVYKVLFVGPSGHATGTDSDILAGIDQAIRDKVDILQMSLGSIKLPLDQSSVSIGSFAAITKGIVPCAAVANDGPVASLLANDAPWVLTVGASTTDRKIVSSVLLGNGSELLGQSANQPGSFPSAQLPLAFPYGNLSTRDSLGCHMAELNKLKLRGKIVLCYPFDIVDDVRGRNVQKAGGVALIVMNSWLAGETTKAYAHVLPAANINNTGADIITGYYRSTSKPTAAIKFGGTQFGFNPTPAVADFSSRGPSLTNGGIIKPDVIAPGVNILAAWPKPVGPTGSQFTFLSGTSMATPHVSGVVALLRNKHPSWSPAEIKSAIMTTAYTTNREGKPITDEFKGGTAGVFARGAGHVDPEAAANPGLVYKLDYYNYVHYLCGYYKSDTVVKTIIRGAANCSQVKGISPEQLNYPSFSVNLGGGTKEVTVKRYVTNVGDAQSVYNVNVNQEPDGVRVDVKPTTLHFSRAGQELTYDVKFSLKTGGQAPAAGEVKEGSLNWDSGKYLVSSPIAVTIL